MGIKKNLSPSERDSRDARRIRKLRAPAHGLNDALVARRQSLREYLVYSVKSLPKVGPKFEAASSDPRLFSYFGNRGELYEPSPRASVIFRAAVNPTRR